MGQEPEDYSRHWMSIWDRNGVMRLLGCICALGSLGLVTTVSGCGAPSSRDDRGAAESKESAPSATSLILITVDTLRADRLSSYGYDRDTSPNIDRLAGEGALFEQAFGQRGLTWPSLTSIMTSRYPSDHGVRDNGEWLAKTKVTLGEVLRDAGFRTAAFLTNMTNAPHRGFEHLEAFPIDSPSASRDRPTDTLAAEAALNWLESNHADRFFLWLHLLAPHAPYAPPSAFSLKFSPHADAYSGEMEDLWQVTYGERDPGPGELEALQALYDAEVAFVDHLVGSVLNGVDELGLRDETLVVFTADHGEELYQRHRYFFHQCSIFDSVLQLPLIFRFPPRIEAGRRVGTMVESLDIAPTIVELLGVRAPHFAGRSLMSLLDRESSQPEPLEQVAFAELGPAIYSVRTPRWRLITNPEEARIRAGGRDSTRSCYLIDQAELYDLSIDPRELHNVIEDHPEAAERLRAELSRWLESTPVHQAPEEAMREETIDELRALGYLQ